MRKKVRRTILLSLMIGIIIGGCTVGIVVWLAQKQVSLLMTVGITLLSIVIEIVIVFAVLDKMEKKY